jgi:hypothetical protein
MSRKKSLALNLKLKLLRRSSSQQRERIRRRSDLSRILFFLSSNKVDLHSRNFKKRLKKRTRKSLGLLPFENCLRILMNHYDHLRNAVGRQYLIWKCQMNKKRLLVFIQSLNDLRSVKNVEVCTYLIQFFEEEPGIIYRNYLLDTRCANKYSFHLFYTLDVNKCLLKLELEIFH